MNPNYPKVGEIWKHTRTGEQSLIFKLTVVCGSEMIYLYALEDEKYHSGIVPRLISGYISRIDATIFDRYWEKI